MLTLTAPLPTGEGRVIEVLRFVVPGLPVGKGRPRIGKAGGHARMFTPAKTVQYESKVALAGEAAMAGRPLFEGAVGMGVAIDVPIPASWSGKKQRAALAGQVLPTTKPDCSNVIKALEDGLNGVVYRDDVLIVEGGFRKRYAAVPCVRVEVWPVVQLERGVEP